MVLRITRTPAFYKAEEALSLVSPADVTRYSDYWSSIIPATPVEILRRWLFAYCSVHTTWECNVRAYRALAALPLESLQDISLVESALRPTGCGLWRTRSLGVVSLLRLLAIDPLLGRRCRGEKSLVPKRDRLVTQLFGLGMAKTAFVLEMLDPLRADVVCIDTHVLQWYGLAGDSKLSVATYHAIETHWVACCRARKIPPAIARHVIWDRRQGRTLSAYWAHVFERE
jgi:hypothetical protein